MPRKVRLAIPLVIQGLSDGREVRPKHYVDDVSGEQREVVQDQRPAQPIESAQAARDRANHQRRAEAMVLLQRVGLAETAPKAKPRPKRITIVRAYNPMRRV